ncbi:MAG: MerR family transcriptional regulator [Deltaproteobacteria bacterium]|nr:MerR family transcriptional regulator [Deltaproteobacteria bacterium]
MPGAARYFTTGDLSRKTGATPRAIRFYEQSGLMAPHARNAGGRRRYTEHDLERLQLITDLRDLDLSIEDIKQLLHIRDSVESAPELGERLSNVVAEQLDRTQKRLLALRRLREELAATLAVVKECTHCSLDLAQHPCKGCDNVTAPSTPRIVKVLLGQCRPATERSEGPLVMLKACKNADDPAQEP